MFTIVVPLDGSKLAEKVLSHMEDLALRLHAEVYFIQAVDASSQTTPYLAARGHSLAAVATEPDTEKKSAEEYLTSLASNWQAKDIDAKWEVVQGSAAPSIVDFARSHKASMIAMSTHGRSGISRLVFGSVADQVMREAGIPVLMVRPGH